LGLCSVICFGAADACGRIIREKGFDSVTRSYERDAQCLVRHVTLADDRTTDYIYDTILQPGRILLFRPQRLVIPIGGKTHRRPVHIGIFQEKIL
jgi:hypothetical protein